MTLTTVTMTLMLVSASVFYSTQNAFLLLKIEQNEQAYQQANMAALSGLADVKSRLKSDIRSTLTNIDNAFAHSRSRTHGLLLKNPQTKSEPLIITSRSTGFSKNNGASSDVFQEFVATPLLPASFPSPLLVSGDIVGTERLTIVSNPNGAGTNLPLSIWASGELLASAIPTTCNLQEYVDDVCHSLGYSNATRKNLDIVDASSVFPVHFPGSLTTVKDISWLRLRELSQALVSHCDEIHKSSVTFVWIEGDCNLPFGARIGTPDKPMFVVIQNGDLQMRSNNQVHGLLLFYRSEQNHAKLTVNADKGALISGAIASNTAVDFKGSTLKILYNKKALTNLSQSPDLWLLSSLPQSWRDFE